MEEKLKTNKISFKEQSQQKNITLGDRRKNNISIGESLRGYLAMCIFIFIIHLSCVPAIYLIIQEVIINRNIYYITFFVIQQIYQTKFCKKWNFSRNCGLLNSALNYFQDWSVHLTEKIPGNKSLIGFHPHGVMCFGITLIPRVGGPLDVDYAFASRVILNMPVSGMFLRWVGVQSVDKNNFCKLLAKGGRFGILPGGFEEATLTSFWNHRVFIKERKGFIKYSMQFGYKVFPCYTFGENNLYYTFDGLLKQRLALNKWKIPGILFISKLGLLPNKNAQLHAVVGKGIQLPTVQNPTREDVDKYHDLYIKNLQEVYEQYKDQFQQENSLEIY